MALLRLHLHILSCIAINVTTGMHIHSQYTECTMLNLFSEKEKFSTYQWSHFTSITSKKCKDRGRKVGSGFTCFMFRQKAMHSILNDAKIPLIPLGIGSSKVG